MPRMVPPAGASAMIRLGLALCLVASVTAFDMSLNTNLAVYWGQNSIGSTAQGNSANWQQPINFYCGDDTIDTLPIAFLTEFFSTDNLPTIDLANTCSTVDDPVLAGTNLPNCSFLAAGIETCQKAGKIVTLSMGGASAQVGFASDSAGQEYAQVIWDVFLGGNSPSRPFGTAVLDGIDMDIEGGSQTGYASFLTALRSLMNGGKKKYYITAAPQCPFPDSYIGNTLNAFGFDAVYVQFYNNYCGLNNFANTDAFNFATWDNWAKTASPNKNVKVYIGAPASSSAAGAGYIGASALASIVSQIQSKYSSFGGVMLWDASQAYANGRFDKAAKAALTSGGSPTLTASSSSSSPSSSVSMSKSVSAPTSSNRATSTTPPPPLQPTMTTTSNPKPTTTGANATTTTHAGASSSSSSGTGIRTATAASPSSTSSGSNCAGIAAWASDSIYLEGDEATYNGQLWKAAWWTEETAPGGTGNGWTWVSSC